MRVKITCTQIVEVEEPVHEPVNFEGFRDSYQDTLNDAQDVEHLTSDDKIYYTPREILNLSIEKLEE